MRALAIRSFHTVSMFMAVLLFALPLFANAGSQTFSTPGAHTFTVPNYTGTLTVEMWGGGGTGSYYNQYDPYTAKPGSQSSWNGNVIAGGGKEGATGLFTAVGGAGGVASGGDINTNGNAGQAGSGGVAGYGGSAPNGGAGGAPNYTIWSASGQKCPTCNGSVPGGGGGGFGGYGSGGGSGAYVKKTFNAGQLTVGSNVPVVVGAGGVDSYLPDDNGKGASGRVKITWGDAAPPPPPPAPACNATTNPTTKTTGTSGSQVFSAVGSHTFTVPAYNGILTVEVWGGGQYPVAFAPFMGETHGAWGGTSIFNNEVYAEGGHMTSGDPVTPGNAWGGDINIRGNPPIQAEPGYVGIGGNAPFGGIGGYYPDPNTNPSGVGKQPGGGGGNIGCAKFICWDRGGASGGYAKKTYAAGDLAAGAEISLYVAAGGSEGESKLGGDGMVKVTWTATGQTLSLCSAGYTLKNGKCVSTAVCATCPAGQTLKTIPGSRIAATSGGSGTPGSQTFSTPGSRTFTVPSYGTLTVEIWGGGAGGRAYATGDGSMDAGDSSWNGTVIARGGKGGRGGLGGIGGIASGGDSNMTGADGASRGIGEGGSSPNGGIGGAYQAGYNNHSLWNGQAPGGGGAGEGGGGGGGSYTKKTYTQGQLTPGTGIPVIVGAGGAAYLSGPSFSAAGDGASGMVKITWTAGQSSMTCPSGYTLQGSECVKPDTTQCVPDTTCPTGFHFDEITQQCTLDEPITCTGGATLTGGICTCPAGTHWDTAQNMCVPNNQCPAGQHWNGTSCVADNCPAGQHWDVAAGACVPNNCPAGQHWNGTQCVANNCPAGQIWNGTQCVVDPNNRCPAGQHWNGTQCVADNCPAGQTWNGTTCACPAGTIWYQNRCQIGMCIPGLECGVDGNLYRKDLQCETSLEQACRWGCTNAACNPPPEPQVITWKVTPAVVGKGKTSGVYWNVMNVESCLVTGTNGDRWTNGTGGVSSGTQVTKPIQGQVTYRLHCTPYEGASWTDRTAIVNIIPVFQEK